MIYSYDEAYNASVKYFKGDELAARVWVDKYALKNKEGELLEQTPDQMHWRIAKELNRIETEKGYPNPIETKEAYKFFKGFNRLIFGGSGMSGIGNDYATTSLSNCFVIDSPNDSYAGILRSDEEQVQLMKRRGGCGKDLSTIRPNGAYVGNAAKTSTGVVPIAERYSNSTRETAQSGRRGALMESLSIRHPDSEEFIDAKLDLKKITGANISVWIEDDFMDALAKGETYIQRFPIDLTDEYVEEKLVEIDNPQFNKLYHIGDGQYIKLVKPDKLWRKIVLNAWKSAEPGCLFSGTIRRESPTEYYGEKTISTNPLTN